MKILFIRHAKALERSEWKEDDLLRPLSEEGIQKAKDFFACIRKLYKIDVIITSQATRALQTAKLLINYYPNAKYFETDRLSPGASIIDIEKVIDDFRGYEHIALIGHEPDFSLAIAHLIGCGSGGNIRLKKAGIAELLYEDEEFEMLSLLYPKLCRGV